MSRSYRHTPIISITTSDSEKDDKRRYNRAYRRAVRIAIGRDAPEMPHLREHSDPWGMAKDGKYLFNQDRFPELMRK